MPLQLFHHHQLFQIFQIFHVFQLFQWLQLFQLLFHPWLLFQCLLWPLSAMAGAEKANIIATITVATARINLEAAPIGHGRRGGRPSQR
jgi:hypothetical protein